MSEFLQDERKKEEKHQLRQNRTGIPTQLKQRMEQTSGFSFDDVRVHYNSDRPKKLDALAYTQGTEVYLGPGQERHLPHELGHVVQQKQGIVRPTARHESGALMNTDRALERQADEIGAGKRVDVRGGGDYNVVQKCGGSKDPPRIPIPGDADYTGKIPPGSWKLAPDGMGAHLMERSNVRDRPELSLFDQMYTPRYYPYGTPENAGQAHIRLHAATREGGIKLRGGNPGLTPGDLTTLYASSYSAPSLTGIRGDLRTPDSSVVIAKDVTPAEAWQELMKWGQQGQGPGGST